MHCYSIVFLGRFKLFRRDLTRSVGGSDFKYHLVCRYVNVTLQLRLEFSLSSLTINSHRGRGCLVSFCPQTLKIAADYMGLRNNCATPQ